MVDVDELLLRGGHAHRERARPAQRQVDELEVQRRPRGRARAARAERGEVLALLRVLARALAPERALEDEARLALAQLLLARLEPAPLDPPAQVALQAERREALALDLLLLLALLARDPHEHEVRDHAERGGGFLRLLRLAHHPPAEVALHARLDGEGRLHLAHRVAAATGAGRRCARRAAPRAWTRVTSRRRCRHLNARWPHVRRAPRALALTRRAAAARRARACSSAAPLSRAAACALGSGAPASLSRDGAAAQAHEHDEPERDHGRPRRRPTLRPGARTAAPSSPRHALHAARGAGRPARARARRRRRRARDAPWIWTPRRVTRARAGASRAAATPRARGARRRRAFAARRRCARSTPAGSPRSCPLTAAASSGPAELVHDIEPTPSSTSTARVAGVARVA